jgi:hypothetical protein
MKRQAKAATRVQNAFAGQGNPAQPITEPTKQPANALTHPLLQLLHLPPAIVFSTVGTVLVILLPSDRGVSVQSAR